MRSSVWAPIVALIVLFGSVPAVAAATTTTDETGLALVQVTDTLDEDLIAAPQPHPWLAPAAIEALSQATIRHIDAALRNALTDAEAALAPLLGRIDEPDVAAAIMHRFLSTPPDELDDLRRLLADWVLLQSAISRARDERIETGRALGIELDPYGRVCPVAGWHRYEHDWGDERPWGRDHKGIDLVAETGTPLVAIERGVVTQADWHWAGGFGIYIHGRTTGQDYYYAHLAGYTPGVDVGDQVQAGDLLGWVGQTGNATTPHLHLGWMPEGGGLDYLRDPFPLIESLCS
jgi:murein DD-endopeptidase MepM/ murein hydrolase activator NlpD